MCELWHDLRLRAWQRSACLLSRRAALSLPLVRYSGTVRPAGPCCLAIPSSVLFRHRARASPPRSMWFKAFQSMRFSIPSSIGCVWRCHVIQSHRVHPLSACPFRHLPRRSAPRLRADSAIPWFCVPLVLSVGGPLCFPFPRSAPLPDGRGGERGVCGELNETARVPMIGWCRFLFPHHLIFDTG